MATSEETLPGNGIAAGLAYRIAATEDLVNTLMSELETIRHETIGYQDGLDLRAGINIRAEVRRYELDLIQAALRLSGNHQRRAAKMLGMNATTLNAKMKKHQIQSSRSQPEG